MSSNSSTGQILGYVVGAVVGYFTLGTGYIATGAAIGGVIGGAIDPPKGPKLVGPRLSDLSQQGASYGTPIPRIYGSAAMFGNIFWIENNALKETSKTEGGGKGGGGGAETTTFKYSATFALGLCEGPIDGVRRIWIGGKLIYDAGSNDIATLISSNAAAAGFRVHLGSETQDADPRMQAALGIANTPAYRGLAYIVFDDLDLTDFGNTLLGAQIKVEVVMTPISETTTFGLVTNPKFVDSSDGNPHPGQIGTCPEFGRTWRHRFVNNSKFYQVETYFDDVVGIAERSFSFQSASSIFRQYDDLYGIIMIDGLTSSWRMPSGAVISDFASASDYLAVRRTCIRDTVMFAMGGFYTGLGDTTSVIKFDTTGPRLSGTLGLGASGWYFGIDDAVFAVKLVGGGATVKLFDDDLVLTETISLTGSTYNLLPSHLNKVGRKIYGLSLDTYLSVANTPFLIEMDLDSATISRTLLDQSGIPGGSLIAYLGSISVCAFRIYDASVFTFWFAKSTSSPSVSWVKSRDFSSGVALREIVEAECLKANVLDIGDLDASSLTDQVRGYRVSAVGALRSAIEPLQGAWPFDVIQSGYGIKFVRRGTASSVATVEEIELDARAFGNESGIRLTKSREMDTQLPGRVTITHLDYDREYDLGEQYAERLNTLSINTRAIDMPIVLTAAEAAAQAEILLYMYWLERYDVQFKLPPSYHRLEPADTITVNAGGVAHALRITLVGYGPDGIIEVAAKFNESAVYQSFALGESASPMGGTIALAGPSIAALLDIPLLLDDFNTAGFPVAMAGVMSGWKGGTIFRSDDNGQIWQAQNGFARPSEMGRALNTLAAPADPRVFDTAGALSVRMFAGELASVTELQLLNGANYFAYGADGRWEIIAAKTCTLQADGSYLLTDLLRGRFGTEWATASHAMNDLVVALSMTSLQFASMNLNQIGQQKTYRAVSVGASLDSSPNTNFTYQAVNLECLSPVWLNGNRHPTSNDWTLTWLRRTRIGGEWRDLVDATLGETSEAYEVEIYSSNTYATLKRTLTGLATATCTYTSAQQVTDFGANQATLYVKVYQLSSTVGRGYPLTTSITR